MREYEILIAGTWPGLGSNQFCAKSPLAAAKAAAENRGWECIAELREIDEDSEDDGDALIGKPADHILTVYCAGECMGRFTDFPSDDD